MNGVFVGQVIKRRRLELDLRQEDIAERTGFEQPYISQVERGKIRRPDKSILFAFANALSMNPDELYVVADYAPTNGEGVTLTPDTIPVRDWGRVPADAVRWAESVQRGVFLDVPLRFARGHSADTLFVLHASGNCLASRGIADGSVVVCEQANGREPRNGKIVAVRIGDDRSLKIWQREGDQVRLYDGDGNVAATLTPADDIEVVGIFLASWYEDSTD